MAFFKLLRQSPLSARIGIAIILLNIVAAILAPVIAPYSETEIVGDVWQPISSSNLLGTDHLGVRRSKHHSHRVCYDNAVVPDRRDLRIFSSHPRGLDRFDAQPSYRYFDGLSDPYICPHGTVDNRDLHNRFNFCYSATRLNTGVSPVAGCGHGRGGYGVC